MKHLGPVRVIYDGPPEEEGRLVNLARVRLGLLAARQLGYPEAAVSDHYVFPDGVRIDCELAGGNATAQITMPRNTPPRSHKRRFLSKKAFILCPYPTSRPVNIEVLSVGATATVPEHRKLTVSPFYTGNRRVGGVARGVGGEVLLLLQMNVQNAAYATGSTRVNEIPDEYTKIPEGYIFAAQWQSALAFPEIRPNGGEFGILAIAESCGGIKRMQYVKPPVVPPATTSAARYDYIGSFGGAKLVCPVWVPPPFVEIT